MSTVGYGSVYPISDYCNIVMLWQSYVNIALLAVITSAVFVNFSRPQYGPSASLPGLPKRSTAWHRRRYGDARRGNCAAIRPAAHRAVGRPPSWVSPHSLVARETPGHA